MTETLITTKTTKVTLAYLLAGIVTPLLTQEFVLVLAVLVIVSSADFLVALMRAIKVKKQITSAKFGNKAITLGAYLIGLSMLQLVFSPIVSQVSGITSDLLLYTPTGIAGTLILRELLSIFEHINSIKPLPFKVLKDINKSYQEDK